MSRINDLQKDQSLVFADGHITSFVDEHRTSTDKEISKKAVRHGIKMAVFERLCQTSAVSAVLSFACTRFRSVKSTDLSRLKVILNGSPWISEIKIQKRSAGITDARNILMVTLLTLTVFFADLLAVCDATLLRPKRPAGLDISSSEPNAKFVNVVKQNCINKDSGIQYLGKAVFPTSKSLALFTISYQLTASLQIACSPAAVSQVSKQHHQIFPDNPPIMPNKSRIAAAEFTYLEDSIGDTPSFITILGGCRTT